MIKLRKKPNKMFLVLLNLMDLIDNNNNIDEIKNTTLIITDKFIPYISKRSS